MTGTPIALVTGAAGGIGGAIARRLHADGYDVLSVDVAPAEGEHIREALTCNLRDADAIAALMADVHARFGPLDLLVNNAGVFDRRADFFLLSADDIARTVEVNLVAPMLLIQAATRAMIAAKKRGVVVNLASVAGLRGSTQIDYSATKAGVIMMTRSLGRALAPYGIRINAVAPGHIAAGMGAVVTDETRAAILQMTPMGRSGEADEVAAVVSYLASPQASYVTGETLPVTGGI